MKTFFKKQHKTSNELWWFKAVSESTKSTVSRTLTQGSSVNLLTNFHFPPATAPSWGQGRAKSLQCWEGARALGRAPLKADTTAGGTVFSVWYLICVSSVQKERAWLETRFDVLRVCDKAVSGKANPGDAEKRDKIYFRQLFAVLSCFNVWPDFEQSSFSWEFSFHKELYTTISYSHRSTGIIRAHYLYFA